jgi:hypothetical protein
MDPEEQDQEEQEEREPLSNDRKKHKIAGLEAVLQQVENSPDTKYTKITEVIYAVFKAAQNEVDLDTIYQWVEDNLQKLDAKRKLTLLLCHWPTNLSVAVQQRVEKGNFRSNIRSTLYNSRGLFQKTDKKKWVMLI